ncbi:MAG: hypothetical protein ACT4N8_09070, partial [Sphingosinicella sp.]|uniref:hypothetical protein n=1 Tax=Sphingosinicella sp. TaxID=1917971 RepID=UPI0040379333
MLVVLVTPPVEPAAPRGRPRGDRSPQNHRARGLVGQANEILENRITLDADALAPRDGIELIADIPTTRARPIREGGGCRWTERDLARLKHYQADVFVSLTPLDWTRGLSAAATYGVWSLTHGDERSGFGSPAGFWEVYFACPVVSSSVQIADGRSEHPTVICRSFSATDMTSVRRNNNNVYWKAASLLPSKLEELQRTGPNAFFGRADASISNLSGPANALRKPPTRIELARH